MSRVTRLFHHISAFIERYPAHLHESAVTASLLRSSITLFLILAACTSVPAIAHEIGGVPHALVFVYLFVFPITAFAAIGALSLFLRFVFLPALKKTASIIILYCLMISLFRNLALLAGISAVFTIVYPLFISPSGSAPSFLPALLVPLVAFDLVSHISAMGGGRYLWGIAATFLFVILIFPAAYMLLANIWSPLVFNIAVISEKEAQPISIEPKSVVMFDRMSRTIGGTRRYSPILYKNRGRGMESATGRIYGLPDERIEIEGGNIFNFDTGEVLAKPPSVQSQMWSVVTYEDFDGRRISRGWEASTNDWIADDGTLRVTTKDKTLLIFSPHADKSAFKLGRGISDIEVVSAPERFVCEGTNRPFSPFPMNFEVERTATGGIKYWGVSPETGSRFCSRCGAPANADKVQADKKAVCSQCGAKIEGKKLPLFELRGGENPVYDIKIEFSLALRSLRGKFFVRYMYHNAPLVLFVDGEKGIIKLIRVGETEELIIPKPARINTPLHLSLSCYDGIVEVGAGEYVATVPIEVDLSSRPPFDLAFGAENGSFVLDWVKISRDQYFTSSSGLFAVGNRSIAKVPSDSYFVLNDMGQNIEDSRSFGCIRSDDIEGIPVLLLWPLFRQQWKNGARLSDIAR